VLTHIHILQNIFAKCKYLKKYFTKKVTLAPDKKTLKELLKAGKKVKGAELIRTEKLVIK